MSGPPFELREAYEGGNLVVVVGPGLSTSAGLPDLDELASALLELAVDRGLHVDRDRCAGWIARGRGAEVLGLLERRFGPGFQREVERRLSDQGASVPPLGRAIAGLAEHLRAAYTTSLDRLLERAFADAWPSLATPRADIAQRRRLIFKLRGTLEFAQSWVLTGEQREQEFSARSLRRAVFEAAYKAHVMLFVGFAPRSELLEQLLAMVEVGPGEREGPAHFIVLDSCAVEERESLERRGLELIRGEAASLLVELGAQDEGAGASEGRTTHGGCPYPGLEAFSESDAALFFGRQAEISQASARLGGLGPEHCYWLAIEGPSGVGKSSFARAGVVPALRRGFAAGTPARWWVATMRPGTRPLLNLARALRDALSSMAEVSLERRTALEPPDALRELLLRLPDPRGGTGVLLLVDQLEELVTLSEADERQHFADTLARLVERGMIYLVTTLRSDFVPSFQISAPSLAGLLNEQAGRYALPPISRVGLREAIVSPARLCGATLEPDMVERLVLDAEALGSGADDSGGTGEALTRASTLPLVAHVLRTLWDAGAFDDNVVELVEYEDIGGVSGALNHSADTLLDTLDEQQREQAKRLLLAMVRVNSIGGVTRRTLAREEAVELGGEQVLLALSGAGARDDEDQDQRTASARLLVVHSEGQNLWVDLVHEALLREWQTLVRWIAEERGQLVLDAELERQARRWQARGRPRWGLPMGEELSSLLGGKPSGPAQELQRDYQQALRRASWLRRAVGIGSAAIITAGTSVFSLVLLGREAKIEQQNRDLEARGLELQQTNSELEAKKVQLERKEREQREALSKQQGMRAQMLIAGDHEPEALLLGVLAVGAYGPSWVDAPPHEAVEGLARTLAEDAIIVTPRATLSQHENTIYDLAYSPDGAHVATASWDGTARVWAVEDGAQRHQLLGHQGYVTALAYSPDGERIASGSLDGTLKIWKAASGEELATLEHGAGVLALAFSPDGAQLVSGGKDGEVALWDLVGELQLATLLGDSAISSVAYAPDGGQLAGSRKDGQLALWTLAGVELDPARVRRIMPSQVLAGHEGPIRALSYSPDGARIATASDDGTARIWDGVAASSVQTLVAHGQIRALSFSPDGAHVALADLDGSASIWEVSSGKPLRTLAGHEDGLYDVSYSPDGSQLATASLDTTARIWDPESGRQLATLRGHDDTIQKLRYSPDGARITTGGWDAAAYIWDTSLDRRVTFIPGHRDYVYGVAYSPQGARVATASNDGTARIWDAHSGALLLTLEGHFDDVTRVVYSPAGVRVATASNDATAKIWDSNSGRLVVSLEGHGLAINTLAYSPDGTRLATGSDDDTVRVWDPTSGAELARTTHAKAVTRVAWSPDGTKLASSSYAGDARIIDPVSGEALVEALEGHEGYVHAVVWSPEGEQLASAGEDGTVRIWSASSGDERALLDGHDEAVNSVCYSPDGEQLASASADGTIRLWTAATGASTGALELVLRGHEAEIYELVYAPEGGRLASASKDGTARVWSTSTGEQLVSFAGHSAEVADVLFAPDGVHVVSVSEDNTAKIWRGDSGELVADLTTHIGLRRADGTVAWPIAPEELTRVGCQRLRGYVDVFDDAAEICTPLLDPQGGASR